VTLGELLDALNQNRVRLSLGEDRLRVEAPSGSLTRDLKAALTEHRSALEEALRASQLAPSTGGLAAAVPTTPLRVPARFMTGATLGNAVPALPGVLYHGAPGWRASYNLVNTVAKFDDFLAALRRQSRFAIDLQTTSLDPHTAAIVGLTFCWQAGEAW
jgi:hypothetical protein